MEQWTFFSNRMKRQTAVCCMSGIFRPTGSLELQFCASFAHNVMSQDVHQNVSEPALDFKSAFSKPKAEDKERCGKRVSYRSL